MSPFLISSELTVMEVAVTTAAIKGARLQSNHHHQQTNTQFFRGRMPFLSPNQQCQSIEGKNYHIAWTCSPQAHLRLPTLSLTIKAPDYLGELSSLLSDVSCLDTDSGKQ